ncbi:MAG: NnrS family protein [Chromatiales bacterium]|nr:NnrS family protein [Chromatiales bacterium]
MQIQERRDGPINQGMTFLALAFRPFFLFAGIAAVLLVGLWLLVLMGKLAVPAYYGPHWHGHEMLFAYAAAVIAGFLLTATKNWTGIQTLRYWPLGGLALLWLLARLLPWLDVPGLLIALVDGLFLPLLALALAFPLFRSRQPHNIPFVFLILAMALGNLLIHLELLGHLQGGMAMGVALGLGMVLSLLLVMGARVIPFFIERGLPGARVRKWTWVERLAVPMILLYVLVQLIWPVTVLAGVVTAAAALLHAWRIGGWYQQGIWRVPLLWVLWLGYALVVLGLAVQALAGFGLIPVLLSLHLLTVGGIGVLSLGMMARVAIGHTGRPMQAHPVMGWAFALLVLAALLRGLMPLFWPESYLWWLKLSGLAWILAFAAFVWVYLPMLIRPRVDGQPG